VPASRSVTGVAWLLAAGAQTLGLYISLDNFIHLDAWYFVRMLARLAIAMLTLAEACIWRSGHPPA